METIIPTIIEILKGSKSLLEAELKLEGTILAFIQSIFRQAFEMIDKELVNEYKEKGYEIDRKEDRSIQFSFGPLDFSRRRMRKRGEGSVVPFDEAMGLDKRVRYSPLVEMKASAMASKTTYRTAAKAIRLLTPIEISHTSVHSMTQRTGETIQEWTDQVFLSDDTPQKDKRKVPVLYIEGDGLMLSKGAQTKRPTLHRVQIHEGVQTKGKQQRPELINAKFFESTKSSQEAFDRASQWIEAHYDLRETVVISNSDGGVGYKKVAFDEIIGQCRQHEHFRDRFHVNQKIKQRLYFDKKMQYHMKQAIRSYDWEKVESVFHTIESRISTNLEPDVLQEYQEELEKLRQYFMRNWASLKPIGLRSTPALRGLGVNHLQLEKWHLRRSADDQNLSKYARATGFIKRGCSPRLEKSQPTVGWCTGRKYCE